MTEDYYNIVDKVNKSKFYPKDVISSFETDIQKSVALSMWYYIRNHIDELYGILKSYGNIDDGYDVLAGIKKEFCIIFYSDTHISINWPNHCILCSRYKKYAVSTSCGACPLGSCSSLSDNPYYTLVKYILHNESKSNALSAIESIIKAIREVKI